MSPQIPIPAEPPEPEELSSEVPDLDAEANPPKDAKASKDEDADTSEEVDVDIHPENTVKKRQIPFEFNQRVAKWIAYFSQKDRERFQRFFDRGEPYREVIQNILEENLVPTDLYYLGMIESGFNAHAKSNAKAVGVWQFMRATGKSYGLSSDAYVDQRRDPIRATEAAAKMLRDLNREFHSWYLAMAAYNAGPGRIRSAIRRAKTHNFWELVEKNRLPQETEDYVPKFLAARYIGENPELFGFFINEEKRYPDVELVKVPSPVPFTAIENACSMPEGTLTFVNPQYLKPFTHPGHKEDEIWVPESYLQNIEGKRAQLANLRIKVKPERLALTDEGRTGRVQTIKVKRGETLKSIAARRGLSVAYLKRVNGLRSSALVPGQRLKLSASSYRQKKSHPLSRKRKRSRR
jgi:membrane-bound lytic murein transglycosylase D